MDSVTDPFSVHVLHDHSPPHSNNGSQTTDETAPRKPKSAQIKLSATRKTETESVLDRKIRQTFDAMNWKQHVIFGISLFIISFSIFDLIVGVASHGHNVLHVIKFILIATCLILIATHRRK